MSQENVEVVRRAIGAMSFDAAADDRRVASVERLASDVEFEEDPRFPEAGTYRGRDEVLRYYTEFVSQFEQFLFTVEDLVDAGADDVLVCLRIEGRGKGSSAEFNVSAGWVFTVRDGQVVRIRAYYERAAAFEAVGLSDL
jgi:ketosteroid isomerase-like protein